MGHSLPHFLLKLGVPLMKKRWILLSSILLAPLGFAADPSSNDNTLPLPNQGIPVTAPQQTEGSWSFGVMGGLDSTNTGNTSVARNTSTGADVTYAFPNTNNDASLSYQRQ